MTILFRGGELEAFTTSGSGAGESTTGGSYNSAFARCAIVLSGGDPATADAVYVETMSWSAQTGDFYLHFEETEGNSQSIAHTVLEIYSGTTANIRIRHGVLGTGSRTWTLQYLNASAVWTTVGSALTLNNDRADYDLFVNATDGDITLFVRGSASAATATGLSLGHMSGFTKARLRSSFFGRYFSQIIADTSSTIGRRLATARVSGVGASTAWTGAYTEIDEIALNDADFINSPTADQVETCAITVPSLTGYVVRDVTVSTRASCGSAGPQNLRHVLRSAGTNYFSASDIALGVGYAPQQTTWETDPATSSAWVNTAIASLQPGVKSIT